MSGASASHSGEALAALAQAFNTQADVLMAAQMAMDTACDFAMETAWGPAGNLTRAAYLAPAAIASGALDALSGALSNAGGALAAMAQSYGASEADTTGLFGSIAGSLGGGDE